MLSVNIQTALNDQINLEFASAYAYLATSAYFENASLPGMAAWMRQQYAEELTHALRLFDHMHDRGGAVSLEAIAAPQAKFKTPVEAFETALKHEQKVTNSIHKLYALAKIEDDYATQVMLEWFIREQVEEEKSVSLVADQLRMAGTDSAALLMMDDRLGARDGEEQADAEVVE